MFYVALETYQEPILKWKRVLLFPLQKGYSLQVFLVKQNMYTSQLNKIGEYLFWKCVISIQSNVRIYTHYIHRQINTIFLNFKQKPT